MKGRLSKEHPSTLNVQRTNVQPNQKASLLGTTAKGFHYLCCQPFEYIQCSSRVGVGWGITGELKVKVVDDPKGQSNSDVKPEIET